MSAILDPRDLDPQAATASRERDPRGLDPQSVRDPYY
jgi:hypothetical protein